MYETYTERLFGGGCLLSEFQVVVTLTPPWQNNNSKSRDFKRLESLKGVRVISEVQHLLLDGQCSTQMEGIDSNTSR